jgi:molybdopterin molybdotransferase
MPDKVMSIEEARSAILAEARPLSAERRRLADVSGLVLAEDIVASHDVPPFDNSTMDGFAVKAADIAGASSVNPVTLKVVMLIPAGYPAQARLEAGEAARIMTGAVLPEGADAVVRSESTESAGDSVRVFQPVGVGASIRRAGADVSAGARVLSAGAVLGPAEVAMAAGLGYPTLAVHRLPRVAFISTGSELVEVDQPIGPGQIRSSNGFAVQAQCREMGIEADILGIAPDEHDLTKAMMAGGLEYDVLLTSGGVSVGDFDLVKDIQDELGVERRLWGVSMKPGRPLAFGVRGDTLVFGLPGNPVATMVSFELFVRPALMKLMGHRKVVRPTRRAVVAEDIPAKDEYTLVVRVRAWREDEVWRVSSTGPQGPGMMRAMIGVNGLAFVPGGSQGGVRAGEKVHFLLLKEEFLES